MGFMNDTALGLQILADMPIDFLNKDLVEESSQIFTLCCRVFTL